MAGFENGYAPGSFLWIVNNIYFQYFSVLITIVSAVVMVAVSYMTAAPDYEKIKGLTFGTATAEDRRHTRASWDWRDVLASALILASILGLFVFPRLARSCASRATCSRCRLVQELVSRIGFFQN